MKINLCLPIFCVFSLAFALAASAQNYSIDWFKVDGGGGTSTGVVFSVSGTVGQPDAGRMSGGNFSLEGGFWGIFGAVPGAPRLSISLTSTNTALISWPLPAPGFRLQQNTNLIATNWVTPAESVFDNGTTQFILVNPPIGHRFYRLIKP